MDRLKNHKIIVNTLLNEIQQMIPYEEGIEAQLIADTVNGHFLLTIVGWMNNRKRMLNNVIHIDVKSDAKVWIQHDGTDLRLAKLLIEKGIPASQIVLGFHSPQRRALIDDFAIA